MTDELPIEMGDEDIPEGEGIFFVTRQYWVKPVVKDLPPEAMEEAFQMNALWNTFVAIGNKTLAIYEKALADDPAVADLKRRYDELDAKSKAAHEEIMKARVKYRTKEAGGALAEYVDRYRRVLKEKKLAGAAFKEARQAAKAAKKDRVKEIFDTMYAEIIAERKRAYRSKDVYWANVNACARAFGVSFRRGMKTGNLPKLHRFQGNARFCLQFTGGRSTNKIWDSTAKKGFSIKSFDQSVYHSSLSQRQRKKKTRSILTYFSGRAPMDFHIQLHRPIPDGKIKEAVVKRTKVGTRCEYTLSLLIQIPAKIETPRRLGQGLAALDVGYRMIDNKLRIGVLFGDHGREDLYLPEKLLRAHAYAKTLQRRRDAILEATKVRIHDVLPGDLPEGLKMNWHMARQGRLVKIFAWCAEHGHSLAEDLARWNLLDKKIVNAIAGIRKRIVRHRNWLYGNMAHAIFDKYDRLVVERLDLRRMALTEPKPGKSNILVDRAKEYRQLAAVGKFLEILAYTGAKRHAAVMHDEAAYTTLKCHSCSTIMTPRDRSALVWQCRECKETWDQDLNAALNMYNAYADTSDQGNMGKTGDTCSSTVILEG